MADSGNGSERDFDQNEFPLHGCRCTELKIGKNYFHVHCPCDICNGKAVPPTTGWRHRERTKRAKLAAADERTRSDEEFRLSLESSVEFSASYSEPQTRDLENLTNPDLLLIGDDNESVMMDDDEPCEFEDEADEDCVQQQNGDEIEDISSENPIINKDEGDVQEFIHDAVLKLVELKGENGFSIKAFEDLLKWGKDLHCHNDNNTEARQKWPSTWEDVKAYLENIGYRDAQLYWICLDDSHPCNYGLMKSKEEQCQHCGEFPKIPYYYLSVNDKVARWCSSPIMCEKMTMHWKQRDHWLPSECRNGWGFQRKTEIWDGKRFSELSFFWDPSQEWILPVYCPVEGCKKVISANELLRAPEVDGKRDVTCPGCFNSFIAEITTTHGDPRNLAYIGHWDGWQPFSTSVRGCGAIEVSIATMSKVDRCRTEEVYVVGFVPSYLLPKKRPISLDPFLEPLITDIEEGFIRGITVDYCIPVCGQDAGSAVIRHLILCWSGDHNGQCEVGKFIKCGKSGCRRCKTASVYIPETNHYYYPRFRQQSRFPAEKKRVIMSYDVLCEIEEEERSTVRQKKAKESGYTGLSILHRLNTLYGFEYDQHMVFDELHGISLNAVKHHIALLKADEDDPIDWKEVDVQLNSIPWTHEFKASRTPRGISSRCGFWKAEDYNKFAFPAFEVALLNLLSENQMEEWLCLCRIVEFLQNHARDQWLESDAETFHLMAIRYGVLLEEHYGPTACHITLHNLLHFKEDITNFGGLDNYSCWVQERAVQRYIHQSNNHKNIECTFAAAEIRREVLKRENEIKLVENSPLGTDKADFNMGWAKSLHHAKQLTKSHANLQQQTCRGILVGGQRPLILGPSDRQKIADISDAEVSDVSGSAFDCRSVWKSTHGYDGLLYREREFIVIIKEGQGEVVARLNRMFTTSIVGVYTSYLDVQIMERVGFTVQGFPLIKESNEAHLVPLTNLSRKVMLFPSSQDENGEQLYILMDFMRRVFPVTADTVVVPYFPVTNDMINVKGDDGAVWKARVLSFSLRRQVVQGRFFVKGNYDVWVPEATRPQEIHFKSILGVAKGHWVDDNLTHWHSD